MYNLFVSADAEDWNGEPCQFELGRCVREYTEDEITAKFGELDTSSIETLKRLPCVFAYESFNELDPKFGVLREIVKRQGMVRVEYDLVEVAPFLSARQLIDLAFELDIGKWELNRTHWAVKNVDLPKELSRHEITLPDWSRDTRRAVDLATHEFKIALSFPGEFRDLVEQIAPKLEGEFGPDSYFYDNNYVAQLARPGLDLLLQGIYRDRSDLIVIFLGGDYQRKTWCGVEWGAIRNVIHQRDHDRIMFVRMDDGDVEGVAPNDGYVDGRQYSAEQIAEFIIQRAQLRT